MTFLRFGVLLALSTVTASMAMEFADPADSAILLEAAPGSKPYILRQWVFGMVHRLAVAGRLSFQPAREGGSRAVLAGCAALLPVLGLGALRAPPPLSANEAVSFSSDVDPAL